MQVREGARRPFAGVGDTLRGAAARFTPATNKRYDRDHRRECRRACASTDHD
jgi:hypothetical protein